MSRAARLLALAVALGADVKKFVADVETLSETKADRSELAPINDALGDVVQAVNTKSTVYKATAGDPIGAGQSAGTWIARPVV